MNIEVLYQKITYEYILLTLAINDIKNVDFKEDVKNFVVLMVKASIFEDNKDFYVKKIKNLKQFKLFKGEPINNIEKAIKDKNIDFLKYVLSIPKLRQDEYLGTEILLVAIENGNMEDLKYVLNNLDFTKEELIEGLDNFRQIEDYDNEIGREDKYKLILKHYLRKIDSNNLSSKILTGAINRGFTESFKKLFDNYSTDNESDEYLLLAAHSKNHDIVKFLINKGYDKNIKPAFLEASRKENINIIKILYKTGNIDQKTLNEALYTASLNNDILLGDHYNIKVVKYLINQGATLKVHMKNQFNQKYSKYNIQL